MARNKGADDLLAELDQLGVEDATGAVPPTQTKNVSKQPAAAQAEASNDEDDPLADLQKQLAVKPAGPSRPSTPGTSKSGSKKAIEHTPASSGPASARTSEEKAPPRTSGEGRSYHQSSAPGEEKPAESSSAGWGGWWGLASGAASAAVKQAESLAKEIRGNEDAQRWAEQVKGNLGHLQSFGTNLRSQALPTFTSLMSHIAPPISAHERLQIHTTHDIQNYPSLDPLIYSTFSRIMNQVEGGDLLVIQRGSERRSRSQSEPHGYRGSVLGSSASSWSDGPWWKEDNIKRGLGTVAGLKEGTRLARVSAESYAKDFFDAKGGLEEAAKKATETLSETNPTRSSDIFLAIQAISYTADKDFFAENAQDSTEMTQVAVVEGEDEAEELVVFAIYLHDPIHSLSFSTLSQPIPRKWADWLDASAAQGETLSDSIVEIIQSGGMDPREWVAEWVEEVLSVGVGVVAQRYVARRMGVGEGGLGRGKRRAEEDGVGGEAARAI
ncbi:hypothetical protein EJ03DRAFT_329756 [Teratosphaeria nubilosa]|uniref:Maintenance of telomere capping protein 1 n=1 Tax=Teratosphaeria nubilosa TaxID=161662 RepID=A0A6G1L217_9PEZI|nr:hypothetical protein EJ03DRAFT_329756 [Teratosphaeria nubilosa]